MNVLSSVSLGDQLSKKISLWILILVAMIIATVLFISSFLSEQMFNKQVNIWKTAIPQYALTNLMDSDHFTIQKESDFIKSTGLFSTFVITDNQKRIISQFGNNNFPKEKLVPINDDAKITWGYYYFKPDFYKFISPFFIAGFGFLILILVVCFIIRGRIRSNLESEFSRFNNFLNDIEKITEKLHEIYIQDEDFEVKSRFYSTEQIIINRSISRLMQEIKKANQSLREAISSAEQQRFQEELTRTALQVTHDIGSPLASLEAIVQSTSIVLPENDRTAIRNAAGRIRDISNSLLQKAKKELLGDDEPLTQQLLHALISQVVSENRIQHGHQVKIKTEFQEFSYRLFSFVRASDFCRVISNLINNAIDAIGDNGLITISLLEINENIVINIRDNGKGISKDVLNKLGTIGSTHGKSHGLGIGLNHAISTIENWGGKFSIQSEENIGTLICISLLKAPMPTWFIPELMISSHQTIVVIDDDNSIHDLWEEKFKSIKNRINLLHFQSPENFKVWYEGNKHRNQSTLYLCDYEFIGKSKNGIDLITELKLNLISVLVTNRMTSKVISECEAGYLKLLPKDIVNNVKIYLDGILL